MKVSLFILIATTLFTTACGTKRSHLEKKDEKKEAPPSAPIPSPTPVQQKPDESLNQTKGTSVATVSDVVKSQFSSILTLVPSVNARLGQAILGTSIFEDTDKTILPSVCMDGTVTLNRQFGTLAMPHALVTDLPGTTYRGMTVDKATVAKLFPNQIPKEVSEFISVSEAATGRYVSSHLIHFKTHDFQLSQTRVLPQTDCGDRFIQKLTPSSFFFFTLRFEIPDEASRTEFAAFEFTGAADELFTHARKAEIVAFLKTKNFPISLVAIQGRSQLDDVVKQLVKDEQCGAFDIEACGKTYNRLKEYQQLAFRAQFKTEPKSLADLGHWGIYEFKSADYKVHD